MGVYHKGGSNADDRTSIFDVSHDYEKTLCPKENNVFLANAIFLILKFTRNRSRTLVWINCHQQLLPKPHYALYIPDVQ